MEEMVKKARTGYHTRVGRDMPFFPVHNRDCSALPRENCPETPRIPLQSHNMEAGRKEGHLEIIIFCRGPEANNLSSVLQTGDD